MLVQTGQALRISQNPPWVSSYGDEILMVVAYRTHPSLYFIMFSCLNTVSSTPHVREKDLIQRGLYAPEVFMDELHTKINIAKVIGQYIKLHPRWGTGDYKTEFVGLCPFHREKTPSFTVSPDKEFFHCFGCGAHGTASGFLQRISRYRIDHPRAIAKLARSVGMLVKYYDWYKEDYFWELERWEEELLRAQTNDQGHEHSNSLAFSWNPETNAVRLATEKVEYYRSAVAAIMEAKDRRYSRFHGKSYEDIVGEPIYPISDELLDLLEQDRADREVNNQ